MPDNEWYQQSLTPPEVIELTLKVGVIPSTDHGQWWIEAKDPVTQILIAQASCPHFPLREAHAQIETSVKRLVALYNEMVEPF